MSNEVKNEQVCLAFNDFIEDNTNIWVSFDKWQFNKAKTWFLFLSGKALTINGKLEIIANYANGKGDHISKTTIIKKYRGFEMSHQEAMNQVGVCDKKCEIYFKAFSPENIHELK